MTTPAPGDIAKQQGMNQMDQATDPTWRDDVLKATEDVCRGCVPEAWPEFTMEHIRWECLQREIPEPEHANSWSTILRTAARNGWCEPAGRTVKGTTKTSKAHLMQVWRSKLPRNSS